MKEMVLNLEELKKMLESEESPYKRFPFINTIGELLIEEEDKKAEELLNELLDSRLESDRCLAFWYLSLASGLEKETENKLEQFKKEEDNRNFIEKAQAKIKKFKRRIKFGQNQNWN